MIASARRNRGVALLVVAWSVAVASVIAVRGLWSDEALSVRFAELTWHELWTIVRQFDPMFVLYYSLLHVWISGGSSEVWDRALSVVFASVTLPIVFRLAERDR